MRAFMLAVAPTSIRKPTARFQSATSRLNRQEGPKFELVGRPGRKPLPVIWSIENRKITGLTPIVNYGADADIDDPSRLLHDAAAGMHAASAGMYGATANLHDACADMRVARRHMYGAGSYRHDATADMYDAGAGMHGASAYVYAVGAGMTAGALNARCGP